MVFISHALKGHVTDNASRAIIVAHFGVVKVLAECTSKVQPLDVGINKPSKCILREWLKNYVVEAVKDAE